MAKGLRTQLMDDKETSGTDELIEFDPRKCSLIFETLYDLSLRVHPSDPIVRDKGTEASA